MTSAVLRILSSISLDSKTIKHCIHFLTDDYRRICIDGVPFGGPRIDGPGVFGPNVFGPGGNGYIPLPGGNGFRPNVVGTGVDGTGTGTGGGVGKCIILNII